MKFFKQGTPAFGVLVGMVFAICGGLVMWLGFWRTLLLAVLFAVGYFLGAVENKSSFVKEAVDRVVPDKKNTTIDFRREIEKQQGAERAAETAAAENAARTETDGVEE